MKVFTQPPSDVKPGELTGERVRLSHEERARFAPKAIRDVRHQRLVHFVRDHDFWIVTDRMSSDKEHTYNLDWRILCKPGYDVEKIRVDAKRDTISTHDADKPNLTIYEFAEAPLKYQTHEESHKNYKGDKHFFGH